MPPILALFLLLTPTQTPSADALDAATLDAAPVRVVEMPDAHVIVPVPVDLLAAPAPIPPPASVELDDSQLVGTVRLLKRAIKDRNWALGAALTLMLLLWALRQRIPALPKEYLPLAGLILSAVPGLVSVLMVPGVSWDEVLVATATIWASANGAWSGAFQPLAKRFGLLPASAPDAPAVGQQGATLAIVPPPSEPPKT